MTTPTLLRLLLALASVFFASVASDAKTFNLTDKQGRSLTAEVLALEGDKVKIKRDDGQVFSIPLDTLTDKDQRALKAWANANPPAIDESELPIQFSRGKFDTQKENQHGGAVTAYKDLWGYNITLTNKSRQVLTDVRAEYILFVKQDGATAGGKTLPLRRVKKTTNIGTVDVYANATFRTESVPSFRYVLKPGWYWSETGNSKPIKDTLHGMWLRIYVGKQLVLEKITSEDIAKNEKW